MRSIHPVARVVLVCASLTALATACDRARATSSQSATPPAPTPAPAAPATPTPTPPSAPAAAAAPEAPAAPANGRTHQVEGITIVVLDSGNITITGTDRWGHALTQTYENAGYFRGALEVLNRSLTDTQAAGVRAFADTLPPSPAPTPAAAPAPAAATKTKRAARPAPATP